MPFYSAYSTVIVLIVQLVQLQVGPFPATSMVDECCLILAVKFCQNLDFYLVWKWGATYHANTQHLSAGPTFIPLQGHFHGLNLCHL